VDEHGQIVKKTPGGETDDGRIRTTKRVSQEESNCTIY
jgi:hypothetical protein